MPSIIITVDIEMKPYLVKFLLSKSENGNLPIKFPRKSHYNLMLTNLVSNYNSLNSIPIEDRQNVIDYFRPSRQGTEGVAIILPFNDRKNILSYNYLSVASKKKFRGEVRLDFNYEFSRFMFKKLREGVPRNIICEKWKKMHDITEDDLKTESLYRYSSRLLEEINSC